MTGTDAKAMLSFFYAPQATSAWADGPPPFLRLAMGFIMRARLEPAACLAGRVRAICGRFYVASWATTATGYGRCRLHNTLPYAAASTFYY